MFSVSVRELVEFALRQGDLGGGRDFVGRNRALAGTRPWVIFLAILGFIGSGLIGLGTVGIVISTTIGPTFRFSPQELMIVVFYLILMVLCLAVSLHLLSYGRRIGQFLRTHQGGRPRAGQFPLAERLQRIFGERVEDRRGGEIH